MDEKRPKQLISYIAPAAPATRRAADGSEPFLRAEIGFTPAWYRQHLDLDFGRRWHTDPARRRDSILQMKQLLRERFGDARIGQIQADDDPPDLLTGVFGTCVVAALYGLPIRYAADDWPKSKPRYLSAREVDHLEPPSLEKGAFFEKLVGQLEWIEQEYGRVIGFINWQGVLNNAYRLRGDDLLLDVLTEPGRAKHLLECVTTTMIDAAKRIYELQRRGGVEIGHFTISNCLVNMVSPETYRDLLLEYDRWIAEEFDLIGIHNCAWNVDPYLPHYASVPNVGYVDMGLSSNFVAVRATFPAARRAVMYTPMDLKNKSIRRIESDLGRIARDLGPCDVVFADIDADTPDERVAAVIQCCERISRKYESED